MLYIPLHSVTTYITSMTMLVVTPSTVFMVTFVSINVPHFSKVFQISANSLLIENVVPIILV